MGRVSPARHLFWVAVGLIVISGALLALQLFYLRLQAVETGERLTKSLSHVVEEQTARTLQSMDQRLKLAANSLVEREPADGLDEAAARKLLREQLKEMPFVRAMWVVSTQGRIKYNSDEGNIGLDLTDRDYVQIYQSQPATEIFIGKPVRSRTTGTWWITIARPLRSASGRFAGVIAVALEPSYFEYVWHKAGLDSASTIALWRRDGLLMMRSPVDNDAMGENFKNFSLFREALAKEPIGNFQAVSAVDGQLRQYAYRTVSSHPELVIAVGQTLDSLLKPWRDFALLVLAIWSVAATFLVILCLFLARAWQQRILAETDAKDLAQRLTLATESAAIGIWDWDVKNERWFASPICFTMLGEEPGDGIRVREQWSDRVHPEDRPAVLPTIQATLDGVTASYAYEARVRHADGTYRWVAVTGRLLARDANGKASRILGVRVDITARKEAEVALRDSAAENRALISAIPDLIFTNRRDGTFLSAHAIDPTQLPVPPDTLPNHSVGELFPEPIARQFEHAFAQALTSGTTQIVDYSLATPDSHRDFEARVVRRDEDTLITIVRDVTERKKSETILRNSEHRYRALVEWSPQPLCVYRNEKIIYSNPVATRMLGAKFTDELVGMPIVELIHPDSRDAVAARLKLVAEGGVAMPRMAMKLRKLDGTAVDVEVQSALIAYDSEPAMHVSMRDMTESNRASLALRQSDERFRSVWDSSIDGMRLCDASGNIISVNSAYCTMVGVTSNLLQGKPLSEVYASDSSERIVKAFVDNVTAGTIDGHFEKELTLRAGKKCWFAVSNTLLGSPEDGGYVLSIFRDISARKLTELALADSEARFRTIVERSPDAMCVYRDGKVIFVNPAAVLLAGAPSPESMIGKHILDLIHPNSRQQVVKRLTAVAEGSAENSLMELKCLRLDGTVIEVEARGTLIAYAGEPAIHVAMRDITAARQAEAALRKSEVALAEAQRVAQLGSWRWDATTGALEWSDELYKIFDRDLSLPPPDDMENRAYYTNESANELSAAARLAMQTGASFKLDLQRNCADGQRRWIGARGEVLRNTDGLIVGLRGTAQNITNRKLADTARASLETQLRESQKMEAIGTLAGGIAHDFNNILATILGNTELARQDLPPDSPILESLEEIKKAGSHARDLVRQILSFSRRAPSERKLLALGPVVHEAVRLLRATLPARLILNFKLGAELPPVLADATQIHQIVINLVNNAMQAIRVGTGRIDIRLSTISGNIDLENAPPSLNAMRTAHPGPIVKLEVRDDGPGMDAATRARVFEPFFTTKPVDEGTGLGLAVVHGIVLAHGGTIVVESAPGEGAAFAIYLPAVESAATIAKSVVETEPTISPPDVGGGQHILYIDDDEALIFLVKRMLERRGYHLHGYTDQREALSMLRANPSQFDLVVTDYNMPGMSGLDVARAVREIRADLMVVVASGFIDETLRAQASGAGVRELIFKANAIEDLCDAFVRLARAAGETTSAG